MLNALNQDLYLIQYRIAIKKGEIIAGQELTMELDRLINDLGNPRYYYDTTEAYKRIHFMEGCIRLTKSPFYGKPMILMLWQKALIEVAYSLSLIHIYPAGKYLLKFAKNHNLSLSEAYEQPIVKARFDFFNRTGL